MRRQNVQYGADPDFPDENGNPLDVKIATPEVHRIILMARERKILNAIGETQQTALIKSRL